MRFLSQFALVSCFALAAGCGKDEKTIVVERTSALHLKMEDTPQFTVGQATTVTIRVEDPTNSVVQLSGQGAITLEGGSPALTFNDGSKMMVIQFVNGRASVSLMFANVCNEARARVTMPNVEGTSFIVNVHSNVPTGSLVTFEVMVQPRAEEYSGQPIHFRVRGKDMAGTTTTMPTQVYVAISPNPSGSSIRQGSVTTVTGTTDIYVTIDTPQGRSGLTGHRLSLIAATGATETSSQFAMIISSTTNPGTVRWDFTTPPSPTTLTSGQQTFYRLSFLRADNTTNSAHPNQTVTVASTNPLVTLSQLTFVSASGDAYIAVGLITAAGVTIDQVTQLTNTTSGFNNLTTGVFTVSPSGTTNPPGTPSAVDAAFGHIAGRLLVRSSNPAVLDFNGALDRISGSEAHPFAIVTFYDATLATHRDSARGFLTTQTVQLNRPVVSASSRRPFAQGSISNVPANTAYVLITYGGDETLINAIPPVGSMWGNTDGDSNRAFDSSSRNNLLFGVDVPAMTVRAPGFRLLQ